MTIFKFHNTIFECQPFILWLSKMYGYKEETEPNALGLRKHTVPIILAVHDLASFMLGNQDEFLCVWLKCFWQCVSSWPATLSWSQVRHTESCKSTPSSLNKAPVTRTARCSVSTSHSKYLLHSALHDFYVKLVYHSFYRPKIKHFVVFNYHYSFFVSVLFVWILVAHSLLYKFS